MRNTLLSIMLLLSVFMMSCTQAESYVVTSSKSDSVDKVIEPPPSEKQSPTVINVPVTSSSALTKVEVVNVPSQPQPSIVLESHQYAPSWLMNQLFKIQGNLKQIEANSVTKPHIRDIEKQIIEIQSSIGTLNSTYEQRYEQAARAPEYWGLVFTLIGLVVASFTWVRVSNATKEAKISAEKTTEDYLKTKITKHLDKLYSELAEHVAEANEKKSELKSLLKQVKVETDEHIAANKKALDKLFSNYDIRNPNGREASLDVRDKTHQISYIFKLAANDFRAEKFQAALVHFELLLTFDDLTDLQRLSTLNNKALTLGRLKRDEDAIEIYEQLLEYAKRINSPEVDLQIARALWDKGVLLCNQGSSKLALDTYEQCLKLFKNNTRIEIQLIVVHVLVNKGIALRNLGDLNGAIYVYDYLQCYFKDYTQKQVKIALAETLLNKAYLFEKLGKQESELEVYDQVIKRYKNETTLKVKAVVTLAYLHKASLLDNEKAVEVYDELLVHFKENKQPELEVNIATALLNKGLIQSELTKLEDAIDTFDQLIHRIKRNNLMELDGYIVKAMMNKAANLATLGQIKVAISINEKLWDKLTVNLPLDIELVILRATLNNVINYWELGCFETLIELCEKVVNRFSTDSESEIEHHVNEALCLAAEASLLVKENIQKSVERANLAKSKFKYDSLSYVSMQFILFLLNEQSIKEVIRSIDDLAEDTEFNCHFNEIRDYLAQFDGIKGQQVQAIVDYIENHHDKEKFKAEIEKIGE